ncbi:MAG TPA: hypothetical protein VNT53_07180 [Pseudolysinimonas sp.]|nr:hypothetical protein [Pseudolysinimonas sp.]
MTGAGISGVGWTPITKNSHRTPVGLATDAALLAIADAGLEPTDIDGLITYFWAVRDTPGPVEMVASLGLTRCNLSLCDSGGGAWAGTSIAVAAAAVSAGLCRNVLVYRAANSRSEPVMLPTADKWPSGTRQWSEPFGDSHAASLFGPYVSAYLDAHGLDNSDFAPLAVQQRAHAVLNTKALMRRPMTIEEHQASKWIVSPFRLLDCSIWNDGGMAVVVSAADGSSGAKPLVTIRAALGGSLAAPVLARTRSRYWDLNAATLAPELYRRAGITASDIDVAELYDPFTGMALLHIEQFGLADDGQAPAAVREGELGLDGRVAVNTHGGHLSEGNVGGLGHVIEAVQQLREGGVRDDLCVGDHSYDRSTCRQVRDPELAVMCGESGDSGVVFGRAS